MVSRFLVARLLTIAALSLAASVQPARAAGDLSRQEPIVVTVELGKPGSTVRSQQAEVRDRQALQAGDEKPEQRSALLHVAHFHAADLHPQGAGRCRSATARPSRSPSSRARSARSRSIRGRPRNGGSCRSRPGASRICAAASSARTARRHADHGMVGEIVIE